MQQYGGFDRSDQLPPFLIDVDVEIVDCDALWLVSARPLSFDRLYLPSSQTLRFPDEGSACREYAIPAAFSNETRKVPLEGALAVRQIIAKGWIAGRQSSKGHRMTHLPLHDFGGGVGRPASSQSYRQNAEEVIAHGRPYLSKATHCYLMNGRLQGRSCTVLQDPALANLR
jgi:hypothetical protein